MGQLLNFGWAMVAMVPFIWLRHQALLIPYDVMRSLHLLCLVTLAKTKKIMRFLIQTIIIGIVFFSSLSYARAQDTTRAYWYSYLADYDGKPGSVIVEMSWFKKASEKNLPYLFEIELNSRHELVYGLPDSTELTRLDNVMDSVIAQVAKKTTIAYVGSFTYQNQRRSYNYVNDTVQAIAITNKALKQLYPNEKYKLIVRVDKEWSAYFKFLYPNEETIRFYEERDGIKPLYYH